MTDELKRRLVGVGVLLAVFSLIAWWIGARDEQGQEIPSTDSVVRNYDVRELDRIAAAQQAEQAVPEPVGEAAAVPEEPVAEESPAEEAPPAELQEAVQPEPAKTVAEPAEPVEPVKAPEPAPVKPKVEEPKVAPTGSKPATDPKGGWIVQVASVTQQGNALQLASKLKSKGWQSFVEEGVVNGTTYYRVRVGPYAERGTADKAAEGLQKDLGQKVAVMSR